MFVWDSYGRSIFNDLSIEVSSSIHCVSLFSFGSFWA